ncbi:phosphodiesterase [Parasphaerochaeta coccoides]|uniref:Phosphoesterase n=1 Tax=Parasphaerochaeta coccoides (strain ATCC BAA-1237 / DSM 17374 / SPN1) TaxID=760011 RepID=F4GHR4_PARC1|nr:phosphodiesterase [Parasphaerochaeta coccoides]AEC01602.1 phosphodiesterase, MJ0936 family [Parasphaerochaeta coccoides DSM 17374]
MPRLLFASDIHGSASAMRRLVEAYRVEKASRLILLGDLLYHGPRNDLPDEYAPKQVIEMLNELKDDILVALRGNCDAEVDQMVLNFPMMADYAPLFLDDLGGRVVYLTHGHVYGADNLPPLKPGDVLMQGHTHVPFMGKRNGTMVLNPGSVALPKGGSVPSYMTYENEVFTLKALDGKIQEELNLRGF